jgi:hypothetical protein
MTTVKMCPFLSSGMGKQKPCLFEQCALFLIFRETEGSTYGKCSILQLGIVSNIQYEYINKKRQKKQLRR